MPERLNEGVAMTEPQMSESMLGSDLNDWITLSPEIAGQEEERLYTAYRQHIVGQDTPLRHLVRSIVQANTLNGQMRSANKPLGLFFGFGVTGSGKTLIAEVTAKLFLGDFKSLTVLHGGEFQLEHEIAKLTGAPPGYIGHDEIPLLTQEKLDRWGYDVSIKDPVARRYFVLQAQIDLLFTQMGQILEIERTFNNSAYGYQAQMVRIYMEAMESKRDVTTRLDRLIRLRDKILEYRLELREMTREGYDPGRGYPSVLLIDEFEKADDSLRRALLRIFDKGEISIQGKGGGTVSVRNTYIFLTSNIAQDKMLEIIGEKGIGFSSNKPMDLEEMRVKTEKITKAVFNYGYEAIAKKFSPEFLGRVGQDNIFAFGPLTRFEYRECLDRILIPNFQKELAQKFPLALNISQQACELLIDESLNEKNQILGVRALNDVFKKQVKGNVKSLMAKKLEEGGIVPGDELAVDVSGMDMPKLIFGLKRNLLNHERAKSEMERISRERIDLEGELDLCTFELSN